jgi:16S rRNA (adenine1518-N6/adenine1519-N6)-dimethyltransferase
VGYGSREGFPDRKYSVDANLTHPTKWLSSCDNQDNPHPMNHQPRKRFGQNFLRDERVIQAIVSAIDPRSADHLVEIGPGQGALTDLLLKSCGRLDLVELDRDLVVKLEQRYGKKPNVGIHSADATRFDFAALADGGKLRLVGNLPYNVSTPLMFHLFGQTQVIADMHFMLQKEVVDRLTAEPGGKDWGRLGIMAGYYCQADWIMDVPPESFYPAPKVMSSVVRLTPHLQLPVDVSPEWLARVVVEAFMQRRKTLRNSLGKLFTTEEMQSAGIDPQARAEMLGLEDYARLARMLGDRGV